MATLKRCSASRALSTHLGDKNESLLMYGCSYSRTRYMLCTECSHMAGLTLKSSDTKSRLKMGLCAASDVKCNGALNIREKPQCKPCKSI